MVGCIQGNSKYGIPTLSIDTPHCGGIRCLDANIVKTPYNYPKHIYYMYVTSRKFSKT
jgi:hypothetical protein